MSRLRCLAFVLASCLAVSAQESRPDSRVDPARCATIKRRCIDAETGQPGVRVLKELRFKSE